MTQREFTNALKSLNFIDRQPWMTYEVWRAFSADPVRFFIRANEGHQDRIWALIEPKEGNQP